MKRLEKTQRINGRWYNNFQCFCGKVVEKRSDCMVSDCGCILSSKLLKNKELPKGSPFTLLEPVTNQNVLVLVRCKCGREFKAQPDVIFRLKTKSCLKCRNVVKEFASIGGVRQHPRVSQLGRY